MVALFGLDGANKEKIKKWHDRVEAIGWVLGLRTWSATPKKKGLDKTHVYLYDRIPPGTRTAATKDIERLVGLLSCYTPGIPSPPPSFDCKSRRSHKPTRSEDRLSSQSKNTHLLEDRRLLADRRRWCPIDCLRWPIDGSTRGCK